VMRRAARPRCSIGCREKNLPMETNHELVTDQDRA
jgi:hypothetical protein